LGDGAPVAIRVSPVRPTVTVIGRRLDPADHRLRDFLTRSAQPFEWLEAGSPAAEQALAARGTLDLELPVVIDGDELIAPASVERLMDAWMTANEPARSAYDLAIVGAGPAGLAAAVYAASDGLSTLVLERDLPGGQASHTSLIENFFGFPEGIGGAELARLAGRQAERFGAEVMVQRGVTGSGRKSGGPFTIEVEDSDPITARAVIAAPGMEWRRLAADGVEELLGRGVYYGAGRSEAAQCGGDPVVVVGAGNSAGQAVMHLAKSMSAYLVERIVAHPLIDVRLRTQVESVSEEDGELAAVSVRDATGATERLPARALFLCLGGTPRTGWASDVGVRVDPAGYVLTGPDLLDAGRRPADWPLARDPLALETSVPGLFAAGDVRHGSTKRVAGAVGDGAMATALVHRRLDELDGAAG
jgi:thioredoxin reductase (NADPH)